VPCLGRCRVLRVSGELRAVPGTAPEPACSRRRLRAAVLTMASAYRGGPGPTPCAGGPFQIQKYLEHTLRIWPAPHRHPQLWRTCLMPGGTRHCAACGHYVSCPADKILTAAATAITDLHHRGIDLRSLDDDLDADVQPFASTSAVLTSASGSATRRAWPRGRCP